MTGKQKTVLIIEVSPAQALALGHSLEQAGLRVLWGRDGQIGVSMAKEHMPDVILLDVEMPKMNGFEACQYLKESTKTSDIPIIMLTVHTEPVTMNTLLDQGAIEFIPKGAFSEAVLLETLRQLQIINNA